MIVFVTECIPLYPFIFLSLPLLALPLFHTHNTRTQPGNASVKNQIAIVRQKQKKQDDKDKTVFGKMFAKPGSFTPKDEPKKVGLCDCGCAVAVALIWMCWSVLRCVAVCCSVLQCAAACCRVWQCVAVCCSHFRGMLISRMI